MITYGTPYTDVEHTWLRYEYLSSEYLKDAKQYINDIGACIFLTKRNNHSFVLRSVAKENNVYTFKRYIIPFYNRHDADIMLHLPSDAYDSSLDIKSNTVAFKDDRFLTTL